MYVFDIFHLQRQQEPFLDSTSSTEACAAIGLLPVDSSLLGEYASYSGVQTVETFSSDSSAPWIGFDAVFTRADE